MAAVYLSLSLEPEHTRLMFFFLQIFISISTSDKVKWQIWNETICGFIKRKNQSKENAGSRVVLKVRKDVTTEKDPIPDASDIRKGKNSTNSFDENTRLKNKLPAHTAPAQLLVILLGVNVNVFMLLYGC